MKNPKLSIVVPCYGVEKYLNRCLESLVNQTLNEIEIILIDDASPDNVPHICDDWVRKDERIKVIHKKINEGLGFARNTGLELATGEYVAFVDSDDYVDTSMYENLYNEAKKSFADVVFCGFKTEQQSDKWVDSCEITERQEWKGSTVRNFMLDMIACAPGKNQERKYQMSVWHSIYRTEIITMNNLRFESERNVISEDIPFQIDFLMQTTKVVYLPECYYYYCLNGTSLTSTFKLGKYEGFKTLCNILTSKSSSVEGAQQRIDRLFIGYTRSFVLNLVKSSFEHKIDVLNTIVNDRIWSDIKKRFKGSWLPIYPRLLYWMIIYKRSTILLVYAQLILYMKHKRGLRSGK